VLLHHPSYQSTRSSAPNNSTSCHLHTNAEETRDSVNLANTRRSCVVAPSRQHTRPFQLSINQQDDSRSPTIHPPHSPTSACPSSTATTPTLNELRLHNPSDLAVPSLTTASHPVPRHLHAPPAGLPLLPAWSHLHLNVVPYHLLIPIRGSISRLLNRNISKRRRRCRLGRSMALQVDMERKRTRMPVDIPSRGEEMLLNGLDCELPAGVKLSIQTYA
jgi:hypothetical protein